MSTRVPEIERILAEVRRMKPCDRCRSPMSTDDAFFDVQGRQVCRSCNARDSIGAAERRVVEGALELAGVPAIAVNAASGALMGEVSRVPWCPRCRVPAVSREALHPQAKAQIHPGWTYVCGYCLSGVR